MLKKSSILLLILISLYFIVPNIVNAQAKYVGTKVCGMCHKTEKQGQQLKIWTESKHSKAFTVLSSDKGKEIAKGKDATKMAECLKCHVGDKALQESAFKEDGVQCETCHGAGSEYKAMSVMKNKEESIKKGLTELKDVEKFCKTCHNSEGHQKPEFKYSEIVKKIAHAVPKG